MRVLLVGPYDPHCGEYTFLAPPLGVWRLKGWIDALGDEAEVFDPNCCDGAPDESLIERLNSGTWDVVGISTTGMTLQYDLALAHSVKRAAPTALLVAGGMEATFEPALVYRLAPFDLVMLGEGEKPLQELLSRLHRGSPLVGIAGTAVPLRSHGVQRFPARALDYAELRESILKTPYEKMPYERYWQRLETAYRLNALPFKAEREARLAEIRSVRLITLNYCPMACTFCSSTNFLHAAQGSVAKIARLTAADCVDMIERILAAQPGTRTIIFQDDIFVFTNDKRIAELCAAIEDAKRRGVIARDLQFISTNRIDAMTRDRLTMMKRVGFRVVGFGVESFSKNVLAEFNKAQIHSHIEPTLSAALELGLRPFLDLIMCSPRSSIADVAHTVREAYRWIAAGCEVGLYPYVVPFSGAAMAGDPSLQPQTTTVRQTIAGTALSWDQPEHIRPLDPRVRALMEEIVAAYERAVTYAMKRAPHLPSRARSLLWIAAAIPPLNAAGAHLPDAAMIMQRVGVTMGLADFDLDALERTPQLAATGQ